MDKLIIMFILLTGTLYDVVTTIYGTINLLGISPYGIVAGVVFGIIVGGMMYYSREVHTMPVDGFPVLVKPLWLLAAIYDYYTSFMGNNDFFIHATVRSDNWHSIAILCGLSLFVCSCPIMWSYIRTHPRFLDMN